VYQPTWSPVVAGAGILPGAYRTTVLHVPSREFADKLISMAEFNQVVYPSLQFIFRVFVQHVSCPPVWVKGLQAGIRVNAHW
jgi:hypothetical protein